MANKPNDLTPEQYEALRAQIRAEITAESESSGRKAERKRREAMEKAKKDTVEIELFQDEDKYKDDVFVCVNGVRYQIQRGVRVKVPRMVSEVLEHSMAQDKATAKMISKFEGDYKRAVNNNMM